MFSLQSYRKSCSKHLDLSLFLAIDALHPPALAALTRVPAVTLDLADGAAVARCPQVVIVIVEFHRKRPADAHGWRMSALLYGRLGRGSVPRGTGGVVDADAATASHAAAAVVVVVAFFDKGAPG